MVLIYIFFYEHSPEVLVTLTEDLLLARSEDIDVRMAIAVAQVALKLREYKNFC